MTLSEMSDGAVWLRHNEHYRRSEVVRHVRLLKEWCVARRTHSERCGQ